MSEQHSSNPEHEYVNAGFERLSSRVSKTAVRTPDPADVWSLLSESAESALVQLLGDDPALRTIDHAQFTEMDPPRPAYGLDAGSTGGIQLQSGHRACRCRSLFGKVGSRDAAWASRTYLQAVIDPFPGLDPLVESTTDRMAHHDGRVMSHTLGLPAPTQDHLSTDDLVTLLQFVTEGLHLNRLGQSLDGPLFLDGALVPLGPAARTELTANNDETGPWVQLTEFALTAFASGVAAHLERGYPVVAISKTQETSSLVDTLAAIADAEQGDDWHRPTGQADSPLPWATDRQFVSHLLGEHVAEETHPRTWVYTPWLVQPEIRLPQSGQRKRPVTKNQVAHYSADAIERAYYFVAVPGNNGIYRVETPRPVLEGYSDQERSTFQQRILRSMATQKGTAEPIARADSRAGLPYEARDELHGILESVFGHAESGSPVVPEQNRDLRWQH